MDPNGDGLPEFAPSHDSDGSGGLGTVDMTSDYDPSIASSGFTSIDTTTRFYRYEHGRRYQNFIEDIYPLPNDDSELSREEMMQHMVKKLLNGKLFMSPVGSHPQRILDLGCGSGQWALEVADEYPSARVLGVDLAPIGPYMHPENVEFKIDDIEAEWPPAYRESDLIHARCVIPTLKDPRKLLASVLRHLRPGGWVEFGEIHPHIQCDDGSLPPENALQDFLRLYAGEFADRYHWDLYLPERMPSELEAAGFVDIQVHRERIPIGPWLHTARMREIGLWAQPFLEYLIENVLLQRRDMDLSEVEARALKESSTQVIHDPTIHAYLVWHSIWAQKPI